jgi:phosphoribosyl 1,2-cyclic phosphodiesterase
MGLPMRRITAALESIKKNKSDLQGILITHEHTDHIKNLSMYKGKVPIYASKGTIDYYDHEVVPFDSFEIGTLSVIPFMTSHDAANPVGYVVISGKTKLVYLTDSGYVPEESLDYLKDADYYIMESNHDLKMLMKSNRPAVLKRRIKGDEGHLSNVDSAIYLSELVGPKTKEIYLAHLSEECNLPELALEAYRKTFKKKEVPYDIDIICLKQNEAVRGGDL